MSAGMVDSAGVERLKGRLEVDLFEAHAVGPAVVAMGCQAGRRSLSLARGGLAVTVIDGSQAALDEVRSLAGAVAIDIEPGDVRHPPVGDDAYDSLLSLDCTAYGPRWLEILPEWVRVVKPGGRLVLGVPSLGGSCCGGGVAADADGIPQEKGGAHRPLVTAGDLAADADVRGLAVLHAVPCGVFSGESGCGPLAALEGKHWWRRLLSWLATDELLLEFALFLEQELVGRLSGAAAERVMVVLERRPDPQANQTWLRTHDDLQALLAGEIALDALVPYLRVPAGEFRSRLDTHLRASLRNFAFFEGTCRGLAWGGAQVDVASFLEADTLARFEDWSRRRRLDRDVASQARDWTTAPGVERSLRLRGVNLADALEYHLVEDLFADRSGSSSGGRR